MAGVDVARFFSAGGNAIVPVTTLEEAAVGETIALAEALEREFQWRVGRLLLNRHSPLLKADSGSPDDDPALVFLRRHAEMEREGAELLEHRLGLKATAVPRLPRDGPDLAMLGQIAGMLDFPAGA